LRRSADCGSFSKAVRLPPSSSRTRSTGRRATKPADTPAHFRCELRFGLPPGRSTVYRWVIAEKASFLPSGDSIGILNQPHLDRPLLNLLGKVELGTNFLRDVRCERNHSVRCLSPDSTGRFFHFCVVDDFLCAGKKRITGKNVARKSRFLVVARNRIADPLVFHRFLNCACAGPDSVSKREM